MLDECSFGIGMTVIADKLDSKLAHWNFDTVLQVERLIEEIIEMAKAMPWMCFLRDRWSSKFWPALMKV